jgi:hypothetical protein
MDRSNFCYCHVTPSVLPHPGPLLQVDKGHTRLLRYYYANYAGFVVASAVHFSRIDNWLIKYSLRQIRRGRTVWLFHQEVSNIALRVWTWTVAMFFACACVHAACTARCASHFDNNTFKWLSISWSIPCIGASRGNFTHPLNDQDARQNKK